MRKKKRQEPEEVKTEYNRPSSIHGTIITEHGGTTRKYDREYIGTNKTRFDRSPVTKPTIAKRRRTRRAKNAAAKRARKANRAG